jgi:hypothetical protein
VLTSLFINLMPRHLSPYMLTEGPVSAHKSVYQLNASSSLSVYAHRGAGECSQVCPSNECLVISHCSIAAARMVATWACNVHAIWMQIRHKFSMRVANSTRFRRKVSRPASEYEVPTAKFPQNVSNRNFSPKTNPKTFPQNFSPTFSYTLEKGNGCCVKLFLAIT